MTGAVSAARAKVPLWPFNGRPQDHAPFTEEIEDNPAMIDGPIVKYNGTFTDAQQQAIGRVAAHVETLCEMQPVPLGFGARWLAVAREISPGRRLFVVSRIGEEGVIIGETVSDLVEKIEKVFAGRMKSPGRLDV